MYKIITLTKPTVEHDMSHRRSRRRWRGYNQFTHTHTRFFLCSILILCPIDHMLNSSAFDSIKMQTRERNVPNAVLWIFSRSSNRMITVYGDQQKSMGKKLCRRADRSWFVMVQYNKLTSWSVGFTVPIYNLTDVSKF